MKPSRIALALVATTFIGCGGDSPTQSGDGSTRLLYTAYVPSGATATPHIISIQSDGTDRRDLGQGGVVGVSGDGKTMATGTGTTFGNDELFVDAVAGGNKRSIPIDAGYSVADRVSLTKSGDKIAYIVTDDPQENDSAGILYVASTSGGTPVKISDQASISSDPAISPDGSRVAYWGMDDHLHIVNSDGSNAIRVVSVVDTSTSGITSYTNPGNPSWSPDGSKLAFTDAFAGGIIDLGGWLVVVDANGSNPRYLSFGSRPAWSPDGSKIAYNTDIGLLGDIEIINADGSGKRSLTTVASQGETQPRWSADGSKVAYTVITSGFSFRVETVDVASGTVKLIESMAGNAYWAQ